MKRYEMTKDKLHISAYENNPLQGMPDLRGGMPLNTPELPLMAAGRDKSATPNLSFQMTMAAMKLIVTKDVKNAKFVGAEGASTPSGTIVVSNEKNFDLWAVVRKSNDGTTGDLELCGMPFVTGQVSYYTGMAVAGYMMLNSSNYPNFIAGVKEAIEAQTSGEQTKILHSIAKLGDELAHAIEQMLDGQDPSGITKISMVKEVPVDLTQIFKGGEAVKTAFETVSGLDKMSNTKVKAVTYESVLFGDAPLVTSFVGELPMKLRDLILRAKSFMLTGPTATGKTKCVREVSDALGCPLSYVGSSGGIEDIDLIGGMMPDEKGGWKFADGPLIEAFRNGKKQAEKWAAEVILAAKEGRSPIPVPPAILLVDEINRLEARFQNIFVSAMNIRPATNDFYMRIPSTNEEVSCPTEFLCFVAARNFGASYVGANSMDLALERRFYKKIDVNYLDNKNEIKLLKSSTGVEEKLAKVLVKVANDSRTQMTQLRAPVDTDTLMKWAEELAYIQKKGVKITDKITLEVAREIVYDVVLERTERGEFDPAGEGIMEDNITESWREVYR